MKKKGFTIIEMLVVLAIISIIMLIATPVYTNVRKNINTRLLESKKANAVTLAEEYGEQTGAMAVTPRLLRSEGKMELDNEVGEYINPVTKEDMACNVIVLNRDEFNNIYGDFTDEKNCVTSIDDLNLVYSDIEIIKKDSSGNVLPNGWINKSPVILSYTFKASNSFLKDYVTEEKWLGESEQNGKTITVSAVNVKTGTYGLYVRTNQNGIYTTHSAVTKVQIDMEAPTFPEEPRVVNRNEVEITSSDGNGSGVYGYYYNNSISSCPTNKNEYTQVEDNNFKIEMPKGTYKICLIDNAGNPSRDTKSVTINAEKDGPVISQFTISSESDSYNTLDTKIKIRATGEAPLIMYLSTTGYETGSSWQTYSESLNFNVGGTYDGGTRKIYLTIRDKYGKTTKKEITYTVYSECTITNTTHDNPACSTTCGNGNHVVTYTTTDKYTNKVCRIQKPVESCSDDSSCTPSCSISVVSGTKEESNNAWYTSPVKLRLNPYNGGYGSVSYGLTTSSTASYNNSSQDTQSSNTVGTTWYGYVRHSNGKTASCNINIKKDDTSPSCSIGISSGRLGENAWYITNVGLSLSRTPGISGIGSYGLTTGSKTYNNSSTGSQNADTSRSGATWYGYVKAGNGKEASCSKTIKKDSSTPSCSVSFDGTKGENDYYISDNVTVSMSTSSDVLNYGQYGLTKYSDKYNSVKSTRTDEQTSGTTWSCYVKKENGLTSSSSATLKHDTSSPICSISVTSGTMGDNNWYTSDVTLSLSRTPSISGIGSYGLTTGSKTYNNNPSGKQTANTSNSGTTWYGYVKGKNGKEANCSLTIKKDSTRPTCSIAASGTSGDNGYYRSSVSLSLTKSSDAASYGLTTSSTANYNGRANGTQSSDTTGTTWYCYVKGANGLTNKNSLRVKKDTVAPTCSVVSSSRTFSTSGAGTRFSCSSDTVTCTSQKTGLKSTHSYTIKDNAGNTGSCVATVAKDVYRKRTRECGTAKSCSAAGCASSTTTCNTCGGYYGSCPAHHPNKSGSSCGDAGGNWIPNPNWISEYDCNCTTTCDAYNQNFSTCGCKTWNKYGSWSDWHTSGYSSSVCSAASINNETCQQQNGYRVIP